jgi:hypothetical protein
MHFISEHHDIPPIGAANLGSDQRATFHHGSRVCIISPDPEMISICSHLLAERGIQTEQWVFESSPTQDFSFEKFDAFVLDCDYLRAWTEIVNKLPRSDKRLILAVASDCLTKEAAIGLGATVIIERSFVQLHMKELLQHVHGRMQHDGRAHFRLAVRLPVSIQRASGDRLQCTTINLSQSGMAIITPSLFKVGERLKIEFAIPKTDLLLNAEGTVIWVGNECKAGIYCEYANSPVQERFLGWLRDHFFLQFDRMETELSLAHGIQEALVPILSFRNQRFEAYGKSVAGKEMGGDLIDIVESEGSLLAYIADVSGHGLAAGQLMGILKAMMRVSLQFHQKPVALLEGTDRILPVFKSPDMYATLALLHFNGLGQTEYASAGHVPILHYRHSTRDTVRLAMEQLPLGLIPGGSYTSEQVPNSPGDIFLMLTDGITEVASEQDEEFGLERLERLLTMESDKPLMVIWEMIMNAVNRYGMQRDDQSLLLLRVL